MNEQKVIDIKEVMRLLDVSESTVRRLFANLEQKGVCIRGHGCIRILSNDFTSAYVYESVEYTGVAEKEIIASKALNLVESGDVIFLDAGTTLAKLCARIADAVKFTKNSGVRFAKSEEITGVITNDAEKLERLAEIGINII